MKLRVSVLISSLAITLVTLRMTAQSHHKSTLLGTIVAVRPGERSFQPSSEILNVESALFEVRTRGHDEQQRLIKLEYKHYGATHLPDELLAQTPLLQVMVKRDKQCDESYRHFVDSALVIKDEVTGEPINKKVIFFGSFSGSTIPVGRRLDCYVLLEDDFKTQKPF